MESLLSEDKAPKKIVEIVFASRKANITPDPKSPRPKIPLTIVNNRKKGRPFQLGAVTMESLRRRSRDPADERSCSMQPLPMRSKPVHHKMRPTGEAEGIRPW